MIRLLAGIFILECALTFVIPPYQAPDETLHVQHANALKDSPVPLFLRENPVFVCIDRAFLLQSVAVGHIMRDPEARYDSETRKRYESVTWQHRSWTQTLSQVAGYCPLQYFPITFTYMVADMLRANPAAALSVARLCQACAAFLILFLAWRIRPFPPFLFCVLALPITIFTCGGAVPDSMSYALCAFSLCIYIKAREEGKISGRHLFLLCLALFAVAAHRFQMLPAAAAPALLLLQGIRDRKTAVAAVLLPLCCAAWICLVMQRIPQAHAIRPEYAEPLAYYCRHPLEAAGIFWNTLTVPYVCELGRSFIGILGGEDTRLREWQYVLLGTFMAVAAVFSFGGFKKSCVIIPEFFCFFLLPVLLVFFIHLVAWTPGFPDIEFILGVQGRHFIPLAILSCMFFLRTGRKQVVMATIFTACSAAITLQAVFLRYYG